MAPNRDNFLRALGARIQAARRRMGRTQLQLAEDAMVSPRTYCRWESGDSEIGILSLLRLCDILNVSLEDLTGRTEATLGPSGIVVSELRLAELERVLDSNGDFQQFVHPIIDAAFRPHDGSRFVFGREAEELELRLDACRKLINRRLK